MVGRLLEEGARVDIVSGMYDTALGAAVARPLQTNHSDYSLQLQPEGREEIVALLLRAGADIRKVPARYQEKVMQIVNKIRPDLAEYYYLSWTSQGNQQLEW